MRFMYSHFFLFGGYCAFPSLIAWTLKLKVQQKHIDLLIYYFWFAQHICTNSYIKKVADMWTA